MQIGMIGLGKMGANMVRRLQRAGHTCVVFDTTRAAVSELVEEGAQGASSLQTLVDQLEPPRALCIMVPADRVDGVIDELVPLLQDDDVVIDGGNSHFQDDVRRAERLSARGVHYVDMGTSGGVLGLDRGYCLMLGGEADIVMRLEPMLRALSPGALEGSPRSGDLSREGTARLGYLHCGPAGAGHFVKMVHNGIEYGLMAAYAEGLNILRSANAGDRSSDAPAAGPPPRGAKDYRYEFDLGQITELWRRGSVVASFLLDLTADALAQDPSLSQFGGKVSDSGEGRWALAAANDLGVPAHVLAAALFERFASRGQDAFQNQVLSAMRLGFGGHRES